MTMPQPHEYDEHAHENVRDLVDDGGNRSLRPDRRIGCFIPLAATPFTSITETIESAIERAEELAERPDHERWASNLAKIGEAGVPELRQALANPKAPVRE